MRKLRDDGPIPWSRGRSAGEGSRLVVDQEKVITRAVDIVQPEIHRREPRQAVVLKGCRRQPTIIDGVIELAVDEMSGELSLR